MGVTCPACRKADQAFSACARCGCDLSRLLAVAQAAAAELAAARTSFRGSDWTGALGAAERSWGLCHTAEAARLAFLAASALGETAGALGWHRRARA